jgi:hypothetical protein
MARPIKMFWSGGRTRWINYGECIGPAPTRGLERIIRLRALR